MKKFKYSLIVNDIKDLIYNKKLSYGEKIPTEDNLEAKYNVSKITVKSAMKILQQEKFIKRIPKKGSFVSYVSEYEKTNDRIVTLIVQEAHSEMQIINEMEKVLASNNILLNVHIANGNELLEYELVSNAINKSLGLAIYPFALERCNSLYCKAKEKGFPIVFIDRYPEKITANCVLNDDFDSSFTLTKHLISKGIKTIGFYSSNDLNFQTIKQRFDSFRLSAESFGLTKDKIYLINDLKKDFIPEGILCANDNSVKDFLKNANYSASTFISYIGEKNRTISSNNLSLYELNFSEIGKQSALMLLDLLQGNSFITKKYYVKGKLIN